jgi:hypothetical protein
MTEKLADMISWSRRCGGFARNRAIAVFADLMAGGLSGAGAEGYPERPVANGQALPGVCAWQRNRR